MLKQHLKNKMCQTLLSRSPSQIDQPLGQQCLLATDDGKQHRSQDGRGTENFYQAMMGKVTDHGVINHRESSEPLGKGEFTHADDISGEIQLENLTAAISHVAKGVGPTLADRAEFRRLIALLPQCLTGLHLDWTLFEPV